MIIAQVIFASFFAADKWPVAAIDPEPAGTRPG